MSLGGDGYWETTAPHPEELGWEASSFSEKNDSRKDILFLLANSMHVISKNAGTSAVIHAFVYPSVHSIIRSRGSVVMKRTCNLEVEEPEF